LFYSIFSVHNLTFKSIPTKDGARFRNETAHLSVEEFAVAFSSSDRGRYIREKNSDQFDDTANDIVDDTLFTKRYHTSWYKNLKLVTSHEFTIWRRNKFRIRARLIQSIVMG
jgi:hypothetical protein